MPTPKAETREKSLRSMLETHRELLRHFQQERDACNIVCQFHLEAIHELRRLLGE